MSERRATRCWTIAGAACLLLCASCATPIEIPNNTERRDAGRATPDRGGPADHRDGGAELSDMGGFPPPVGDAGWLGDGAAVGDASGGLDGGGDATIGDGAIGDATIGDGGGDAIGDAGAALPDASLPDATAAQ